METQLQAGWFVQSGLVMKPAVSPRHLAHLAVQALVDEAELTPKPALVDRRGNGAHYDLSLPLLIRSAYALEPYFLRMAEAAHGRSADIALRERLGLLGREAEQAMMKATGGVNAHRGAIWALGLLVAATSQDADMCADAICRRAAMLAMLPDGRAGLQRTNGALVACRYGSGGARAEAQSGFPHVLHVGLPALRNARRWGRRETHAQLDTLLAIMMTLEDTCLLHRGGREALAVAQNGAASVLESGGSSTAEGQEASLHLHESLMAHWASPGGSADLLAATLFIDRIANDGEVSV